MPAKKIIVVVGATGNQGTSVANTFLKLPAWHVRCLTRNPHSDAASALRTQGAQVIQGDLTDPASLTTAFQNAHAVFVNTDFWTTWYPAKAVLCAEGKSYEPASEMAFAVETLHGKNAVDAAAAVPSLERFVYSALPGTSKVSNGKYTRSKHFEAKGWVVEYISKQQPELWKKTPLIYVGAYTTNRLLTPRLDPTSSGRYAFVLPVKQETRIPIINVQQSIGQFVRALVEEEEPGVKLLAYDSYLTAAEIAEVWSRASGKEAVFVPIAPEAMHDKMGVTWEHLDSQAFINEYGYTGGVVGVVEPAQLKRKVATKSWEDQLKEMNWTEVLAA
ncbi:hypothetical protein LTR85_002778 [Meristemomyces frigidus]|nr:hypothetical protein LTR85_002778 [Meristemomyces frigidus]